MKSIAFYALLLACVASRAAAEAIDLNDITTMRRLARIQELAADIGREAPDAGDEEPAPPERRQRKRGAEIFHRNGVRATWNGSGEWFYPSGKRATWNAGQAGSEWFWPNGRRATWRAGTPGTEWFYPNGRRVSWTTGDAGAEFFFSNGQRMTFAGPGISADELLNAPKFMLWLLWVDGVESSPF